MIFTGFVTGLSAFEYHGRAKVREGGRLYAFGIGEVDGDITELRGEHQAVRVEDIDAAVVWVLAGIVMDVDAGEWFLLLHDACHSLHHILLGRITVMCTRPDAVVIILVIQPALVLFRSGYVADEDRHGSRQHAVLVFFQQALQCIEAGGLIAMQQRADK